MVSPDMQAAIEEAKKKLATQMTPCSQIVVTTQGGLQTKCNDPRVVLQPAK